MQRQNVNPDADKTCSDNFWPIRPLQVDVKCDGKSEMTALIGQSQEFSTLLCDGVKEPGNFCKKEREIEWCENFSRANEALF